MTRQVLLIVAYDSQLKWARLLGERFTESGWTADYVAPSDIRSALSEEQIRAVGMTHIVRKPWDEIVRTSAESDAVVLGVQGPLVEQYSHDLDRYLTKTGHTAAPVVVAGWVGVIIEKETAGYLDRCCADVIAVNSRTDLARFTQVADRLGLPQSGLMLSGLPLLPPRSAPMAQGPVRTVVFADQPTVPASRDDRSYVYSRLVDYARKHPKRTVLLKPRHRPEEDTFHAMRHHPETLVAEFGALPANFKITYEPITDLLDTVDLLMTVSSTAALESVGRGVRTALIADLGIHEKLGNHVFLPSGLLTTFDAIDEDDLPEVNPTWLQDVFIEDDELAPAQRVVRRVTELVDTPATERPRALAMQTTYVHGRAKALIRRGTRDFRGNAAAVHTTRWTDNFKGRSMLVAHAVLPHSWVTRLKKRFS